MRKYVASVVVAAVAMVAAGVGTALAHGGDQARWVPPDDTIVKVTGNAEEGFGIEHYDGTALFPPTDSEARAECLEYDKQVQRIRCKTEVRVWYRDLAGMKASLRWARQGR
jgi:hypothetical protein